MSDNPTLEDIICLCEGEVSLTVDEYTSLYQTFDEGLDEVLKDWPQPPDIIREMKDCGYIICLQAYPRTPVGFEIVFGGTVQSVVDQMYDLLTKQEIHE